MDFSVFSGLCINVAVLKTVVLMMASKKKKKEKMDDEVLNLP